jgi:hypothetical protein
MSRQAKVSFAYLLRGLYLWKLDFEIVNAKHDSESAFGCEVGVYLQDYPYF